MGGRAKTRAFDVEMMEDVEPVRFMLPPILDNASSLRSLFALLRNGQTRPQIIDFSECNSISHVGYAFVLGCVQDFPERFHLDPTTVSQRIFAEVNRHFFWLLEGRSEGAVEAHAVPSREFKSDDDVIGYLLDDWLGPGWVIVSDNLKRALAGRTYEIFANAWEHSSAEKVFCCGRHREAQNELQLAIIDFGHGIPGLVRPYILEHHGIEVSDTQCLKWAMQKGATTSDTARGLGLDLLKEFVEINHGQLDIYSHSGHLNLCSDGATLNRIEPGFMGTLVNITFRCDNVRYQFASEVPRN